MVALQTRPRALIALYDAEARYYDREICLNEGIELRQLANQRKFDFFQIYPNPASDKITLKYLAEAGVVFKIKMYDSITKCVYSRNLTGTGNLSYTDVDINFLVPGIYYVNLILNDRTIGTSKLVIIE